MLSFSHFLRRGAVVGLAFAAVSAPSVAGASTASTTSMFPAAGTFGGTYGPVSAWVTPYGGSFHVGTEGCSYVLRENLMIPVGTYCTMNGYGFGAYMNDGVLVPYFQRGSLF